MPANSQLRLHVINVGHGDSIVVELPDLNGLPRFGLVDAGGEAAVVRDKTRDYIRTFLDYRRDGQPTNPPDFVFEFVCLTHPHMDHYYGMLPVLEHFFATGMPRAHYPKQFWDCGFRHNAAGYMNLLRFLSVHRDDIQFTRVTSGTEFHMGDVEIVVLAPSIDMRNRFDTYGVDVNDASVILKLTKGRGVAVLAADAHFDTWGKVCEEFPRDTRLVYASGGVTATPAAEGTAFESRINQLNCQFLKVSHHGSKRGTSYEYVEKLSPTYFAVSCDDDASYQQSHPNWVGKFPHPLTRTIIGEETGEFDVDDPEVPDVSDLQDVGITANEGTMIYTIRGNGSVTMAPLGDDRSDRVTVADLQAAL